MAGVEELIRVEDNNTISFGNHMMETKRKIQDFEVEGDMYKVKTFKKMTKLERNGRLLYESEPGTSVYNLALTDTGVVFNVEGIEDAQITVELEAGKEYKILISDVLLGKVKSNLAGKMTFNVDFESGIQKVEVKRA